MRTESPYHGMPSDVPIGLMAHEVALRPLPTIYRTGNDLRKSLDRFPNMYVPTPELENLCLYLGTGSYENLRSSVMDSLKGNGLMTANVQKTFNFVEKAYEGRTRNTGEPEFAHVLRIVGNVTDFIVSRKLWNPNHPNYNYIDVTIFDRVVPISAEGAEMTVLTALLHDFVEVEEKDGEINCMGRFCYDHKTGRGKLHIKDEADLPQIRLERLEKIAEKFNIVETLALDFGPDDAHFLGNALNELEVASTPNEKVGQHALKIFQESYTKLQTLKADVFLMAFVTKLFDRLDNLATYTFKGTGNPNEFSLQNVEKMIKKANETLDEFPLIEELVALMPSRIGSNIFPAKLHHKLNLSDHNAISISPTLWAKMMLMGVPPNALWRKRQSHDGKLLLPRLI